MAWKRRRRRIRTVWELAPVGASLASRERPVTAHALRNLAVGGTPTGTLAVFPIPLELGFDDLSAATVSFLTEGAVESRTLLRFVGMIRPIGLFAVVNGGAATQRGCEVRYALYRGQTQSETASFSTTTGVSEDESLAQPDLFSSSGLANERIAWMRSFIMPQDTSFTTDQFKAFDEAVMQTLPWHKDAALSVIDFQSKRRITTDSRFWLLKQLRMGDANILGAAQGELDTNNTQLYDATYGRLLCKKVSA